MIPPRAGAFQRRVQAGWLGEAVAEGGTVVLCQVLSGMGGVGKTQLAAEYARMAWERGRESGGVDVLVWISAGSREAIVAAYAQAGADLCGADSGDADQAARAFLAWLQPKPGARPCRWLVVLDDVTDPAHLRGLWPPASPLGRVLVTTRRRDAALTGRGRVVSVGVFTEAEAVAYLTQALSAFGRSEPDGQLAALARDLGFLPLALAQAAAYLSDTLLSCAGYRALLAGRKGRLADLVPEDGALPDDQRATVAATWALSIEHADTLRPAGLARPMLHLTALLDPNGIPATVLTSQPALTYLTENRTPTSTGTSHLPDRVTAEDATLALRALHRLSLIDHAPATPHIAVRVHQLIQRATRDTLTPTRHDHLARTAADALTDAWPGIERDTGLAGALRANAAALTHAAEDALYRPDAHPVLFRTGRSLGEAGQVTAALTHFHRMAQAIYHHLGPDHPHTLITRSNLARWRGEAGDVAGAAAALEELLADMVRVLGPDHPDTLTTRHNIASWRGEAGDAAGAAAALEELLADVVRVLGSDHPDTLTTRSNLAYWRGEAGDVAGAAVAFEELLADVVRVLGSDHPDTLTTRHNLAGWRGEAGDVAGAAVAFEELLADVVRVLGSDHPDTLTTRNNLAHWRGRAGDAAGAVAALEELLADSVRVLGPDHPDTLTTRHNIAYWRGEAGDVAGAAAAFEELLADRVRVLGPDHPHTLTTRHNIAYWRGEAGDAAGAAAAFGKLLADVVRVLGPDHPHTLTTRSNLARWRIRATIDKPTDS
ncbi:tetratricopeptide repeat protein [Streptomyces hoynatensis]|uniref:Tetratricopeptide repeat protein n=1 Tax=Streptomyces hoynatensis TaxID=1141874 RepID=A0A3A9YY09_9ACTN|nr:FxSxx-COOH system tetratricopeptide repeat protein [Streptomyces hoynatensis]RKN40938.1 tetratricopeptide repeat protein [Streptomyces hoynatensis]